MNQVPGKIRADEQRNIEGWSVVRTPLCSIFDKTIGTDHNEFFYLYCEQKTHKTFSA